MTPQERRTPKILNGSRRARIARGSGVTVTEVNNLVDRFYDAQKMMKQLGGAGGMPGMPGMPGMGRKAKRQQSQGKKGKKGPGRAGGGPAKQPVTAKGQGLPQGFPQLPGGANPPALPPGAPDPFGLRRPR